MKISCGTTMILNKTWGYGGIGIHNGLKIRRPLRAWGFESPYPYHFHYLPFWASKTSPVH